MTRSAFLFVLLTIFPLVTSGQQQASKNSLTDVQQLGRRVFEQRCPICHVQPQLRSKRYGPALYKDLIDGNEVSMGALIRNGVPDRMPGFRYALQPAEIDAIVEYLKTVPKPPLSDPGNAEPPMD